MNTIQSILIFLLLGSAAASADTSQPDPAQWYRDSYGTLWHNEPWNKLDEIGRYYDAEIQTHDASDGITTVDFATWMAGLLVEWKSDGWLSSEVSDLKVDRLNASTVSFKSRWLDYYREREDESSCGWYLADLRDGQWKFTNYATIDCAEHGF